jgi:hypothetical protein
MRPELPRADLLLVVLAVLVQAALVLLTPDLDGPLRVLVGVPFVLVAPGYALQAAMFDPGSLGRTERAVLSLGLSIAVGIIAGLLLNLTPAGLNRDSWSLLLGAIAAAGAVAAMVRGRIRQTRANVAWPKPLDALSLLAATVMLASAFGVARAGAAEQRTGFTQFWLRPVDGSPAASGPLRIGVHSYELAPETFQVEVRSPGAVAHRLPSIELHPGESWEFELPSPTTAEPVEAVLYRDGVHAPYRRVWLAAPAQTTED